MNRKNILLKNIFFYVCLLAYTGSYSQNELCNLDNKKNNPIYSVSTDDIRCLAINTPKDNLLLFTFGMWCSPCIAHLPNALKLAKDYNLDLYVLLIDEEDKTDLLGKTSEFLKEKDPNIKIAILTDQYGGKRNKKYKKFLKEITPRNFENINDMSKYIIFDKEGNVIMITSWKDNKDNEWKDDSKMIKKTIIPVLTNKN